jgi:prolyl-tRNA editing enzyme YbaK/EbsC (Cys-tRNA(Pro) deacylase)
VGTATQTFRTASLKTLVIRADNNVVAVFHIVEQRLEVQNIAAEHP